MSYTVAILALVGCAVIARLAWEIPGEAPLPGPSACEKLAAILLAVLLISGASWASGEDAELRGCVPDAFDRAFLRAEPDVSSALVQIVGPGVCLPTDGVRHVDEHGGAWYAVRYDELDTVYIHASWFVLCARQGSA